MLLSVAIAGPGAQHTLMEGTASLTDATLLDAYERATGEQGDPAATALIAKIERRELDI